MMANRQYITPETNAQLPARPDMLQTGDPCPCCGQPIKTRDPELLLLLTYIRDSRCNQAFTHEYMDKREAGQ